ncbi:hypothetical protein [Staphylococcus shinii]|uniref:hypothetical protein n=1 Tax=Staphylococcus shinii TaxID=2912228 RepID=UPI003F87CE05
MNTINKIKDLGQALIINIVTVLFLIGLTVTNVAIYLGFGLVIGLIATGITLIILSIILMLEQSKQPPE